MGLQAGVLRLSSRLSERSRLHPRSFTVAAGVDLLLGFSPSRSLLGTLCQQKSLQQRSSTCTRTMSSNGVHVGQARCHHGGGSLLRMHPGHPLSHRCSQWPPPGLPPALTPGSRSIPLSSGPGYHQTHTRIEMSLGDVGKPLRQCLSLSWRSPPSWREFSMLRPGGSRQNRSYIGGKAGGKGETLSTGCAQPGHSLSVHSGRSGVCLSGP